MRRILIVSTLLLGTAMLLPPLLEAQEEFTLGPPLYTLSVRVGAAQPPGEAEIYDHMIERMTLEKGDFLAGSIAAEIMFRASERFDIGFGIGYARSRAESEYREWVYPDDSPIAQTTTLRRVPLNVSMRFYPLARGEAISNYAYVPARFSPYLAGGTGIQWYRLQQEGDFMDYRDYQIFSDEFIAKGSSLASHVAAGAEYWWSPKLGLAAEGRYSFANADPGDGFREYDEMDLGGFQVTAGLAFRF